MGGVEPADDVVVGLFEHVADFGIHNGGGNQQADDDDEGEDPSPATVRPLSQREVEEFEQLTTGIVHLLDQYSEELAHSYA